MTATYWEFGRRIVEFEQGGSKRAAYGEELLRTLSADLSTRFGRGFSVDNLELFRAFYLAYPRDPLPPGTTKSESPIRISAASRPGTAISDSAIRKLPLAELAARFPLSWTHYVQLLRRTRTPAAREFYEREALRGGWSVRQLTRQISSLFYERTALSRDKAAMLGKGAKPKPGDQVSAEEEVKDPLVLEFLDLKDEYSGAVGRFDDGLAPTPAPPRSYPSLRPRSAVCQCRLSFRARRPRPHRLDEPPRQLLR